MKFCLPSLRSRRSAGRERRRPFLSFPKSEVRNPSNQPTVGNKAWFLSAKDKLVGLRNKIGRKLAGELRGTDTRTNPEPNSCAEIDHQTHVKGAGQIPCDGNKWKRLEAISQNEKDRNCFVKGEMDNGKIESSSLGESILLKERDEQDCHQSVDDIDNISGIKFISGSVEISEKELQELLSAHFGARQIEHSETLPEAVDNAPQSEQQSAQSVDEFHDLSGIVLICGSVEISQRTLNEELKAPFGVQQMESSEAVLETDTIGVQSEQSCVQSVDSFDDISGIILISGSVEISERNLNQERTATFGVQQMGILESFTKVDQNAVNGGHLSKNNKDVSLTCTSGTAQMAIVHSNCPTSRPENVRNTVTNEFLRFPTSSTSLNHIRAQQSVSMNGFSCNGVIAPSTFQSPFEAMLSIDDECTNVIKDQNLRVQDGVVNQSCNANSSSMVTVMENLIHCGSSQISKVNNVNKASCQLCSSGFIKKVIDEQLASESISPPINVCNSQTKHFKTRTESLIEYSGHILLNIMDRMAIICRKSNKFGLKTAQGNRNIYPTNKRINPPVFKPESLRKQATVWLHILKIRVLEIMAEKL